MYLGKHDSQRIWPLLSLHLGVVDNIEAIGSELVSKKHVHEKHLADNIGKVENLTAEILEEVE